MTRICGRLRRRLLIEHGRSRVAAIVVLAVLAGALGACRNADPGLQAGALHDERAGAGDGVDNDHQVAVASVGRVEGASETVDIGAGVDGVIAELRVREGDHVHKGDVLVVIDRRELHAQLSAAAAAADAARQARTRLLRGSRDEDRERADAEASAEEAIVHQAEAQLRRTTELFAERILSEAERDDVQRNFDVAKAQWQAARKRAELVNAPALPEDVAKADADVRSADEQIRLVQQTLDKSIVRAPIDGTVLRTMLKPGETFSIILPQPILSMADTSRLRVRAEVDERDVSRVFAGQRVLVRGDNWDGHAVPGRVTRLRGEMGKQTVKTGDPAEKSDRDVLEVLVDLDASDSRLVVGLRVTALFLERPLPVSAPAEQAGEKRQPELGIQN